MNRRNSIIGVLVLTVLAVVILWDGDEPDEPTPEAQAPAAGERQAGRTGAPSARPAPGAGDWSARPRQDEPRWPPSPEQPGAGYETADPWYYGQRPSGRPQPYPQAQAPARQPYDDLRGYAEQPGYAPSDPRAPERYHFRPLTEKERERMEQSYPAPAYPSPYYSVPEPRRKPPPAYARPRQPETYPGEGYDTGQGAWPSQPYAPEHYAAEPYDPPQPYSGWQDSYNFRPLERPPGAAGRGQAPDQGLRGRDADPARGNAWTPPSQQGWEAAPPSWAPPAERMYPSLPGDPDRRFTYR